jgi:hypothetical protein
VDKLDYLKYHSQEIKSSNYEIKLSSAQLVEKNSLCTYVINLKVQAFQSCFLEWRNCRWFADFFEKQSQFFVSINKYIGSASKACKIVTR